MPARDFYHDVVKNALIRDGWMITHDPYILSAGLGRVYVDLGAEQPLAAEKAGEKIAVEVKSFRGESELYEFERAIGQYVFYRSLIAEREPERKLFLAVPFTVFEDTFQERITRPVLEELAVPLIVFQPSEERIVRWIS